MKYDFSSVPERRQKNSYKWDIPEGEIPMWVADMDFFVAPEIVAALSEKLSVKAFGYGIVPDEWALSYQHWWERRHGFFIEKDWLIFATGVVPILSSCVRKLTTPAERVVVLSPCYNIFYNSIRNNGRVIVESPLIEKREGQRLSFEIDWENLTKELTHPQTTLLIFCNPHNPVGRLWTKEEMARIGELCKENGVIVLSDEIHCDLVDPGLSYIPFASCSETCRKISATCIAPTKAFNIAGLQTAAVFTANPFLYRKIYRALNTDEVAEPNTLAVEAAVAAFEKGEPWLDELLFVLKENKTYAKEMLTKAFPSLAVTECEATYLLWVDAREICQENSKDLADFLRTKGVYIAEGSAYGRTGAGHLRINLACPKQMVEEGIFRIIEGIKEYKLSRHPKDGSTVGPRDM